MKTKEFKLSEKIIRANKGTYGDEVFPNGVIKPSDIKEFIKRLKEELAMGYSEEVINKLAGDKLI